MLLAAETPSAASPPPAHGDGAFDFGHFLIHHVEDTVLWELPWQPFGIPMHITKHVLMMWIAAALCIGVFVTYSRRASKIPGVGVAGMIDSMVSIIYENVVVDILGHENGRRYGPYLLSAFFFILFCNLLGMVPGAATATGNTSVTAALAILTFLVCHIFGMREQGVGHYWVNFIPHQLWHGLLLPMGLLMFVLELIGHVARTVALCIRLFANMVAGHFVISALIGLIFLFKNVAIAGVSIPMAVGITLLEVTVAFIQAYVFTLLTTIFIGAAVHPEH